MSAIGGRLSTIELKLDQLLRKADVGGGGGGGSGSDGAGSEVVKGGTSEGLQRGDAMSTGQRRAPSAPRMTNSRLRANAEARALQSAGYDTGRVSFARGGKMKHESKEVASRRPSGSSGTLISPGSHAGSRAESRSGSRDTTPTGTRER